MKKNSVLKNSAWIIACRIIQSLSGIVVSTLTARYLGPSNYGLINYVASVVAFAAPFMKMGFNHTIVNEITNHSEHEGEILGTVIGASVISSFLCIIGAVSFVYLFNGDEKITIIICVLYSLNLTAQALEMIQYWFQAKLISHYTSVTGLVAYFIVSAYRIFLLVTEKSIYWFAISQAFDYYIIAFTLLFIYHRVFGRSLSFSFARFKDMFAKSRYYIISSLMITVFAQTDKIMLKTMLSEEAVGIYSAAVTCAGLASFVFGAIIDSFRPVIFQHKASSPKLYEESVISCYSVIIYLSLLQSVVCTIFSRLIISILYGNDFAGSANVLRVIVWYCTFSYLGSVRDVWMLSESKQKHLWIINMSGALTNVILNSILIPYGGVMGAAIASVITQVFTNVVIGFIMKPIRENNRLMLLGCNPKPLINYGKQILCKARKMV